MHSIQPNPTYHWVLVTFIINIIIIIAIIIIIIIIILFIHFYC